MKAFITLLLTSFVFVFSAGLLYADGYKTSSFKESKRQDVQIKFGNNQEGNIKNEGKNIAIFLTQKDWLNIIGGAILGWVLGFGSVWVIDKLKEPNLVFEKGSIDEKHPTKKWRFIHIKIKNLKRRKYSPFTTIPAFACKAIVRIGRKEFVGRWTSKEEPLTYVQGGAVLNINAVLVHPREDIQPTTIDEEKESVQVVIGLKYENEDKFYGFNNESYSYQPDLKHKNLEFSQKKIEGEITIFTLGNKYSQKFVIYNKSKHRKDFWLELI